MDIASLSLDEIIIKLNKEDGSCTSNGKSLFIRAKQLMTAENKLRAKAYADHLFMVMEEQGKAAMFKDYIKNPKYSAISRLVFPASRIAINFGSIILICVYFLFTI